MRKIVFFIFCFFFLTTVRAESLYVLGLGDSITTGYGVEIGYFEEICSQNNWNCENLAVNGMTSTELLDYVPRVKEKIEKADQIFMSIGGNDFLRDISSNVAGYVSGKSTGTAANTGKMLNQNLKQIYEQIFKYNAKVDIYVVPLYNPYLKFLSQNESLLSVFDNTKKEYNRISKEYPQVHISASLSSQIEEGDYLNASLSNIDPHPNQKGHQLIASEILKVEKENTKKKGSFIVYIGIAVFLVFLFTILIKVFKKK